MSYALGQAAENFTRGLITLGKEAIAAFETWASYNPPYPSYSWAPTDYGPLGVKPTIELNPYQIADPEVPGGRRYSGYTGVDTGYDTPSEQGPGPGMGATADPRAPDRQAATGWTGGYDGDRASLHQGVGAPSPQPSAFSPAGPNRDASSWGGSDRSAGGAAAVAAGTSAFSGAGAAAASAAAQGAASSAGAQASNSGGAHAGTASGAVSGAETGASIGGAIGGPVGAAIGGVVGGATRAEARTRWSVRQPTSSRTATSKT